MDPLVFEPYARPQVWGQRRLESVLGKQLPPTGTFGECWEISAHPHHVSRVAEGSLAGTRLDELWRDHREEIAGPAARGYDRFPLLIKYLDCDQQLSVQVHPTDDMAAKLIPGELGKTEAWVVLEAEPTARIYAGLRPGMTRADLVRHLEDGAIDNCLHSFVPHAGDCVFLRAGTVHAVGGGVLMAEVQQSSDATFRLFDWNRRGSDGKPRELHIQQSLESIDWSAGPTNPVATKSIAALPDTAQGELLVRCRYFEMARFRTRRTLAASVEDRASIWLVISGQANLMVGGHTSGYQRRFHRGDSVLVPVGATEFTWTTDSHVELLRVILP
jgi:mannose-6-phosphate isomerase